MYVKRAYYLNEIGGKKNQEDYIWPRAEELTSRDRVFIVCDGVGGSANGEIASKIISESLGGLLQNPEQEITTGNLAALLASSKQDLLSYARQHRLNNDMATTLTMLVLRPQKAFIAWCGDSRLYHIRNGVILYKTEDHSLVNSLVKKGEITEDEARTHPKRNVILKAITADDSPVEIESRVIESVQDGDYFLLCSDGLLENITENDIRYLLSDQRPAGIDIIAYLQEKCEGKTRDNYSMYLVQVNAGTGEKAVTFRKTRSRLILLFIIIPLAIASLVYFIQNGRTPPLSREPLHPSIATDTANPLKTGKESPDMDSIPEIKIISTDSMAPDEKENTKPVHP